jgi:hypothetical protein
MNSASAATTQPARITVHAGKRLSYQRMHDEQNIGSSSTEPAAARYNPFAVVLVAFLVGGLQSAGNTLQGADLPSALGGELLAERSGALNLGVEGMMLVGAGDGLLGGAAAARGRGTLAGGGDRRPRLPARRWR